MNWSDVLPHTYAVSQVAYDRKMLAYRMRKAGLTFAEIGARLGCGGQTARLLVRRAEDRIKHPAPIEIYLREVSDLRILAKVDRQPHYRKLSSQESYMTKAALNAKNERERKVKDFHEILSRRVDPVMALLGQMAKVGSIVQGLMDHGFSQPDAWSHLSRRI